MKRNEVKRNYEVMKKILLTLGLGYLLYLAFICICIGSGVI